MHLKLRQRIEAPPDAVWAMVTAPEWMNRWSSAMIDGIAAGDGGRFDTVGALRRVTIRSLGQRVVLPEVVQRSEPAHRLVYRVVNVPQVRFHRGEMRFAADGGATDLVWDVAFDLVGRGVQRVFEPILRRQLRASLARLAALDPPRGPGATLPPFHDPATPELWAAAREVLGVQQRAAREAFARDDPARWFAQIYAFVTEEQLAYVASGDVDHPGWVLRLIPRFQEYWQRNLDAWRAGRGGEFHWRRAFAVMGGGGRGRVARQRALLQGMRLGIVAHIEEDLPRALADVYLDHYESRCDFARFRAEYILMEHLFRRATERLVPMIPWALVPLRMRAVASVLPDEITEAYRNRRYYNIPSRRLAAFERGDRLVTWARGRIAS